MRHYVNLFIGYLFLFIALPILMDCVGGGAIGIAGAILVAGEHLCDAIRAGHDANSTPHESQ